jgi:regulator of sirC expression with transglutaminase-like and TPR domain
LSPGDARDRLLQLLRAAPDPFPLDRAALLLAADRSPGLDIFPYEDRLDAYACRASSSLPDDGAEPRARLAALRRVLFEEEGFHGNRQDYYDVRNSYLHEVLDRKLGIPISLAVLMVGVARRLDWPLQLVNFPMHVLVRYEGPDEILAVDPFHGGLIIGADELEARWRGAAGTEPPDEMLDPAPARHVLMRMLNNIVLIHSHHGQRRHAEEAAELRRAIEHA